MGQQKTLIEQAVRSGVSSSERKRLPDQPGVYLFYGDSEVIYIGKAVSIRKRVASHFSSKVSTNRSFRPREQVTQIEYVVVKGEGEALFLEQSLIRRHRPKFNIRLRDDKSYPYIAVSIDEDFPRIYFTRERHRKSRIYFGPYSNAKHVRATIDLLRKVFYIRSCEGKEPGRRSGSPCLDYHIDRCKAPCVDYVSKESYREGVDAAIKILSGRYTDVQHQLKTAMQEASSQQQYEQAAAERNRLKAITALREKQSVVSANEESFDAFGIAASKTDVNVQVFQVRDGSLVDRRSLYYDNQAGLEGEELLSELLLGYYVDAVNLPALVVVEQGSDLSEEVADILSKRRSSKVTVRSAERGVKRRTLELAKHNAELALSEETLKAERRLRRQAEALEGLKQSLGMDALPMRIECYDISHLAGTKTVASMVVFEGGVEKKSDYRRFKVDSLQKPDDFAAMEEVLRRRTAQWRRQQSYAPHDSEYDGSFSELPDLIVIDGGKGQLSSAMKSLQLFTERGVTVVSLAKRLEEVFLVGSKTALNLDPESSELQLLQRLRDEAHRFAITHNRGRRSEDLKGSVLDRIAGVGPKRKALLLKAFGSPAAVLEATREELESVPGLPAKTARELYQRLNRLK